MADCEHLEVDLTSWRGEAGYVECRECHAVSFVSTSYGWEKPEDSPDWDDDQWTGLREGRDKEQR